MTNLIFQHYISFKNSMMLLLLLAGFNVSILKAQTKATVPVGSPLPGKWKAVISNGYQGDILTFRVKPDGKTIENVAFKGYWRSSGRTEPLRNLDPPGLFKITNAIFSDIKKAPDSRMWWEFTGAFETSTTAKGTYRAAYAGGQSDTYKLKWTAKRIAL